MHRAARADTAGVQGEAGTEELREAMVEARALFEDLVRPARHDGGRHRGGAGGDGRAPARGHQPWAFGRRHPKES